MTKVKSVEFWLFALPVLFGLAAWTAVFDHDALVNYFTPAFLGVWLLLAVFWMFREMVRRFRS
jgi:hypothetical protein